MKLPPIPEQQALRAAVPAPGRPSAESGQRHAALLQLAQSGVPEWVRAMVDDTAAELASSNQRNAVAGDRQYTATALAQLQGHREALIAQLVLAMQHQLKPGVAAARDAAAAARAAQPLQLIEESQIDEDIEIARIVQAIESESDWELRQLRALSSGLLGLPAIDENAAPLGPLACATGLRLALSGLGVDGGTRLLLMRVLGPALGRAVKDQYAELSRRLRDRKVGNIESVKPDVIAAGNFGCIGNIAAGTGIPIAHTVELLDWATGGPRPAAFR